MRGKKTSPFGQVLFYSDSSIPAEKKKWERGGEIVRMQSYVGVKIEQHSAHTRYLSAGE